MTVPRRGGYFQRSRRRYRERMSPRLLPLFALVLAVPASAQVASVEVTPDRATLIAGNELQLSAVARDAAGRPAAGARFVWSAVPFDVATVDSTGRIRAHRQGRATVFATAGDRTGSAVIEIEPKSLSVIDLMAPQEEIVVGGSLVLQATARTEDGEPLRETVFTFRTSDDRVAAVDQFGVVTGRGDGTAFLVATAGDGRGEVRLKVVDNRVTRLAITGPVRGKTGDVIRLRPLGEDRRQLPVQNLAVRWSVSGTGASIGDGGEFVADRPGTYLVTANAGAVAASHAIRVAPRPQSRRLDPVGHLSPGGDLQTADVAVTGTAALVTSRSGRLYAVDLRDPARPVRTDSLAIPADLLNGIAITDDGKLAVVARAGANPDQNGLVLLDLTDPLHPKRRSEFRETLPGGARSVFLDGRVAYVADATGTLRIISLEDPALPREVGGWAMNDNGTGRHLRGIEVKDGLAYLAYWRHGLIILDVGNGLRGGTPGKPELVGHFAYNVADWYPADWSAGANAVLRHRNYVFLADDSRPGVIDWAGRERIPGLGRVHVIDVSDPARPVRVAEYHLPDRGAQGLWVEDDVLYVAFGEGGLRALDVSGELRGDLAAQGREIGAIWTGDPRGVRPNLPMARAITGRSGLLVATDVNSGLWLARLTPPAP
jgi:hypothetical protein